MPQLQKWVLHLAKVDRSQASHRSAQIISEGTRHTSHEIPVSLNNAHTHTCMCVSMHAHIHMHTHCHHAVALLS